MRSLMEAPLGAATFRSPIAQPKADRRGLKHIHPSLKAEGRAVVFDTGASAPLDSASRMAKPLRRSSRREDNPMRNQDWFTEADCDNDELTLQKLVTESGKPFRSVDGIIPNRLHTAA